MSFSSSALEASKWIKGELTTGDGKTLLYGVSTDSRTCSPGEIFFALRGETDGHAYLEQAVSAGASCCVVDQIWSGSSKDLSAAIIVVDDTTLALGRLAKEWRKSLSIPVAIVTGSVGKTTTKQIAAAILTETIGPGVASEKSFNNHIGLPLTILKASSEAKWLVLEAGMNHSGELDYLSDIAQANVGACLNVGPVHMENFQSVEEIAKAKCEIFKNLSAGGVSILNGDDRTLQSVFHLLSDSYNWDVEVINFSVSSLADYRASSVQSDLDGLKFVLNSKGEVNDVVLKLFGAHNVYNALAAITICKSMFSDLKLEDISKSVSLAVAAPMRSKPIDLGEFLLINDTYNANPVSFRAALDSVSALSEDRGFCLMMGDMLELGEKSREFHFQIGAYAAELGAKLVFAVGDYGSDVVRGVESVSKSIPAFVSSSAEVAANDFLEKRGELPVVLVKGSRGLQMERAVTVIEQQFADALSH